MSNVQYSKKWEKIDRRRKFSAVAPVSTPFNIQSFIYSQKTIYIHSWKVVNFTMFVYKQCSEAITSSIKWYIVRTDEYRYKIQLFQVPPMKGGIKNWNGQLKKCLLSNFDKKIMKHISKTWANCYPVWFKSCNGQNNQYN